MNNTKIEGRLTHSRPVNKFNPTPNHKNAISSHDRDAENLRRF